MKPLRLLPAIVVAAILTACASVGHIDGGPRDEEPPVFVRSNPSPGQTRVSGNNFTVIFDENVQLDDAFNKVVVSPAQLEAPTITANGRRVSVHLRDTLKANTTYTIDFGDAIKDLNEGNILDGFALDFSTGDSIDSLRISGIVLGAQNLEPAQGVIVGAYSNLSDTAIRTLPPDRIARTNQYGQFTIRNLPEGQYRVYAINDINRDWHWDRSENVAFMDVTVSPRVESISVTDTLYSSTGEDSLVQHGGLQYLPNDILLSFFNEDYRAQYLKDYKRPERRFITVELGAPTDSLPRLAIVDGPRDTSLHGATSDRWGVPIFSSRGDSLTMWLTDSAVYRTDSLRLWVRYMKPDSLDRLVWTTDTLRFFYRDPKRSKKEIEADTLPPRFDTLPLTLISGNTQEVYKPLIFSVGQPLQHIDTAMIHFEMQVDTNWVAKPFAITADSLHPVLQKQIDYKWEPGAKYRLSIDSAAIHSVYGEHNKRFEQEIAVRALEDYSNLTVRLTGADSTAVVELLGTEGDSVRVARAADGKAIFRYVQPGSYYLRMFFDTDGNGEWTTGRLDSIQPEEVAYYPKKIELKRNWDVEQDWDIYELPVDKQKPYALLKNKPKLKRGETAPNQDDENAEEDEFMGSGYQDNRYNNGNDRYNNRNNRNNNRNNMNLGGMGGFRQMTGDRRY